MTFTDIKFASYEPGGLSTLCALQSAYYAKEWGFTQAYESVVAASISEFLERYTPERDFIQLVKLGGAVKGGIVIDSSNGELAQLHWFILSDELRGTGAGRKLMTNAMDFVRKKGYPRVYLTTFKGLDSARRLYEEAGFKLTESQSGNTWGREVTEQRFDWYANRDVN